MKHIYSTIVLAIGLFIFTDSSAQTGTYVPELAEFDTAMLTLMNNYGIPGAELAITYYGRLVYNRGFGYADSANNRLVQPANLFRLASCSKPITAVTLMHLYEQGRFRLDDTVFGPNGILNDTSYQTILDPRVYQITVRELLTHSGGWNDSFSVDPMFNSWTISTAMGVTPPANSETVIKYTLANQMLDFNPGAQYAYSNFGYCILGRVIEKLTGQNYTIYVQDSILAPMGITDMAQGHNLIPDQLPAEVYYYDYPGDGPALSVYDNVTEVPWPYGGFNIQAMDAHGGWVASAEDMCKFLVSVDGFPSVPDVLTAAIIDTMVSPSATNVNYALGWEVNSANNWWHIGSLPGTETEIVRSNGQLNWVLLFNTRPYDVNDFTSDMDNLVWSVLPNISTWPSFDLFTGVTEVAASPSTELYPVPANDYVQVKVDPTLYSDNAELKLFDEQGREVLTQPIAAADFVLQTSGLSPGIYLVQIVSAHYNEVRKIVVQH